jgi:hypothetical protein
LLYMEKRHTSESNGYFGDQTQGSSSVMTRTPSVQPAPYRAKRK